MISFGHVVGGHKQCLQDSDASRFGVSIDDWFELDRLCVMIAFALTYGEKWAGEWFG